MNRDELAAALAEHAYLEGDFVLRSGRRSRYYLDKYRFETRPDLLGPLGQALADAVAEDAVDVWFDDGSIVSLSRSSPAGSRLAELAEDVLSTAR